MNFSRKPLSQIVTQLCLAKQIDHVVISPGSRNAPLIIGFTEHPSFKNFSIVDERCASFFALGMAQQLQKPVALVCTSGSALLNYYPAIAEAFYSDIPLVIISADRPAELIDVGDGQTIRQENVFANHILYSANCVEGGKNSIHNETEINKALNIAIESKGPVHINLPFSEPLYELISSLVAVAKNIPPTMNGEVFSVDLNPYVDIWNSSKKIMILVGVAGPNTVEEEIINRLAAAENVLVLTETTSNLHHPNFIPAIDQLIASLNSDEFTALQPDVLLTFGGMVVSKKVKAFLRNYPPKHHWHIDSKKAFDTYFRLNMHFRTSPSLFLKQFLPMVLGVSSEYQRHWLGIKRYRLAKHKAFVDELGFSDLKAFSILLTSFPHDTQLQLANSATIRYAQLFDLHASISVFCNRGTSGIDGCTSTAIGAAQISKKPTVLISGDLAFFYDSNALWNNYIPTNFRMIVVNNKGGGIFRILPGAKNATYFKTYFETEHQLSARHLCEMHNIAYSFASNQSTLELELQTFFEPSKEPRLLEIQTPSDENDQILRAYFETLK